jgi:hypothetical protein
MIKKNANLTIKLEGDLKRRFLEAIELEKKDDKDMSKTVRALLKAYIAFVAKAGGQELPPFRLEGFDEVNRQSYPTCAHSLLQVAERKTSYGAGINRTKELARR